MSSQNQTIKDIQKLQADFQENGKAIFLKYTQQLFASVPELESISWNQYTPTFNDGDPCEFTLGELSYNFFENVVDEEDSSYIEEDEDEEDSSYIEEDEDEEDSSYIEEDKDANIFCISEYEVRESKLSNKAKKSISDFDEAFSSFSRILEYIFEENKTVIIKRDGSATVEDYDLGY